MMSRHLLTELHRHQATILAHTEETRRLARGGRDCTVLAKRRWELVRLLRAYQLFKHAELFDPVIRRGSPEQRQAAERMKRRCLAAGDAWIDHVRRWSGTDVAGSWNDYVQALDDMVERLRAHIANERRDAAELIEAVEARLVA